GNPDPAAGSEDQHQPDQPPSHPGHATGEVGRHEMGAVRRCDPRRRLLSAAGEGRRVLFPRCRGGGFPGLAPHDPVAWLEHRLRSCGNPGQRPSGRTAMTTRTAFGRIFPPRPEWLARAPKEAIIDPDLPIIDTHHHLWERRGGGARGESWDVPSYRYLIDEFLADCATGHNMVGSVF